MFALNIKLRTTPRNRKEVLQTLEELSDYMTQQELCLKTDIYQDAERENTFYFIGQWRDRETLESIMSVRFMSVVNGFQSLLEEPIQVKQMILHELEQEMTKHCYTKLHNPR